MKKNIAVLTLLLISFLVFPEKWVGQVATYNLIEGSVTADGQVFDPNNMTAACNGFRLGAKVKVINVRTGKQVEVLVNDRIRTNSNYFILLSPKAADELGLPWETSLVVIDAKFSDVNSTEILPISGLVAEGTVDKENLKKFPDINWPNGDKTISKLTEEKPVEDKYKKPVEKDSARIDTDTAEKEQEKIPKIENERTPDKIMQKYMLDEDGESRIDPEDETYKKPAIKEKNIDTDEEDKIIPENDMTRFPNKREKGLSEDEEDGLLPKKESMKKPEKQKNLIDPEDEYPKKIVQEKPEKEMYLIDTDESEKVFPDEEMAKTPLTKERLIDPDIDDRILPKEETAKLPEKDKLILDPDIDDRILPKKETAKLPEKDKLILDPDVDGRILPKKETVKLPEKDKLKINEDKNAVSIEKAKQIEKDIESEKIEWLMELPKGKMFIRFSTTFERIEGERRINLFKKVFGNIVGLQENNKFILLIGPVEKKDIDKILKGLRNFGYKDSYIIQK